MKRKLLIIPLMAVLLATSACQQKDTNYQQYKRYIATLRHPRRDGVFEGQRQDYPRQFGKKDARSFRGNAV